MGNLKNQMAADVAAIFLNPDEFAEEIQYNGHTILAIPEFGDTNEKGNTFSSEGSADRAFFSVSSTVVPDPLSGDEIIHNGKAWEVVRYTPDGYMNRIECIANESAVLYGR